MEPASIFGWGLILKAFGVIVDVVSKAKKKLIRFKDDAVNREVKKLIIEGNVNAPVVIVERGATVNFGDLNSNIDWIKERLDKGKPTELIVTDFSQEYNEVTEYFKNTPYLYPYIQKLDSKYRSIIKTASYIDAAYQKGDRDIAAKRKNELNSEGKKFCNLYTEGYIPDFLKYIEETGLQEKIIIQQLLDYVVKYKGVLFVHGFTDIKSTTEQVEELIFQSKNYIAIHGTGSNIPCVKKIEKLVIKMTKDNGYKIENKETPSQKTPNGVPRYAIFIFDEKGKGIYDEFIKGIFKGFI